MRKRLRVVGPIGVVIVALSTMATGSIASATAGRAAPTDASPTPTAAVTSLGTPAALVDCAVEARAPAEFAAAGRGAADVAPQTAAAPTTPAPLAGKPADAATVREITATLDAMVACLNAGDLPAVAAFLTDRYFASFFAGIDASDIAKLATPTPLPPDQRVRLVSVEDVRVLDDGRVSAVTQIGNARALSVFVLEGGRCRLDGSVPLESGLQATATP